MSAPLTILCFLALVGAALEIVRLWRRLFKQRQATADAAAYIVSLCTILHNELGPTKSNDLTAKAGRLAERLHKHERETLAAWARQIRPAGGGKDHGHG